MTKIAIDARESGSSTGRYIDKLVEYLHAAKPSHEIVVLTKKHRIDFMETIAPRFTVIESPFREFSFGEQLGFKKQLKRLKPDLVHFGMVQQPVLYRGKVVTTMHDLTTVRFRNPSKNFVIFTIKQQIYKQVNKRAARKSKHIIVPSEYVKQDVVAYTKIKPSKVTVTYEAGDKIMERPEPLLPLVDKSFVMYVGRPTPHKNIKRLVQAFALLKESHPDLMLVLVGKTDNNYRQLAAWVERKKIKNVMFTDFVTDGELRWLYEHCQTYVFPSLSEGFGLPGLEAMAHGCPVVSSNATCLPEIYKDGALYFDPLKPAGIAEQIARVLDDPRLRRNLIIEGSVVVKQYSWERMAKQTLDIYENVLRLHHQAR